VRRHRCWRCGEERPAELVCASCGAIHRLREDIDYFTALGLPAHPAVDPQQLETSYYVLSRRLHPDRHQTGNPDQLAASVRASALLNQAYRTLRDVESRGRYWLKRQGEDLGRDNNRVPASLAAFVFDVQERLGRLRSADAEERPGLRRDLDETHDAIEKQIRDERDALTALFEEWPPADDGGESAPSPDRSQRLKRHLSELSYLKTLDREVRTGLEN
jgi:molecular chaperone HscB